MPEESKAILALSAQCKEKAPATAQKVYRSRSLLTCKALPERGNDLRLKGRDAESPSEYPISYHFGGKRKAALCGAAEGG